MLVYTDEEKSYKKECNCIERKEGTGGNDMHWRKGCIVCLAVMLCILEGCEKKSPNEFVQNVKASPGVESNQTEDLEIMGQIKKISAHVLTLEVVEKLDGKKQPVSMVEPPAFKKDEKPDGLKSKKPLEDEEQELPEDRKPVCQLMKMGKELEIEIQEDTEIVKNKKKVAIEELEKDEIVYIEIKEEEASKVRVSQQKYEILEEMFENGITSMPE